MNKDMEENKRVLNLDTHNEYFLKLIGLKHTPSLPGFNHYLSKQPTLDENNEETKQLVTRMKTLFTIVKSDQPVSFATNTLFALEMNKA